MAELAISILRDRPAACKQNYRLVIFQVRKRFTSKDRDGL